MNAKHLFGSLLALGLLGMSVAQAGPVIGTAKARGDYSSSFGRYSRSYSTHARSSSYCVAPQTVASVAPYRVASPPAPVAQTPAEGRRFSYRPVPGATAPTATENRGLSDQPTAAMETAPPQVYRPSYGRGASTSSRSHRGRDLWSLPKTDPRKYGSR